MWYNGQRSIANCLRQGWRDIASQDPILASTGAHGNSSSAKWIEIAIERQTRSQKTHRAEVECVELKRAQLLHTLNQRNFQGERQEEEEEEKL